MADRLVREEAVQVQLEGVDVILGQEPEAPGPTISPYGFHLWRNGTEITPNSEWDATWREQIGGVSEASVTVQNREGVDALDFHEVYGAAWTRDIIKMTYGPGNIDTDWCLWEGEVVTPDLDLPVGFDWRFWKLGCTDWNTVLDLRLLGAPDGIFWAVNPGGDADAASTDPGGPYPIDPDAAVGGSDRITIQNWYDAKVRAPDGGAFDTDEFVGLYIDGFTLFDPITGEPHLVPSAGPVKGAISELAGLASFPVYDWIDPDRKVHHVAYDGPDGLTGIPRAPFQITDIRAEWNGTTKIGGRGLHITADRTYGPEEVYVTGVTPIVELASDDPDIAMYGGRVILQGTGWGHAETLPPGHTKTKRQMMVEGKTVTPDERDKLADTHIAFGAKARYRGTITVGGRDNEVMTGLRAGQLLTITDERLPTLINAVEWPIQALSGSLSAGDADVLKYVIEFGDGAIERFSSQSRRHVPGSSDQKKIPPKPAAKFALTFQRIPKPGETETIPGQMVDYSGLPVRGPGVPVHWEFIEVTDKSGVEDRTGNGESLSPTDTITNEDGSFSTQFTAGTLDGTYYNIEASAPVQVP